MNSDRFFVTEYQYRPLTESDTVDWYHWTVKVVPFDVEGNVWGVKSMFMWVSAEGEWIDPAHSDGSNRFDLDTALRMARDAQWTLQINGKTAIDIINMKRSK